MILRLTAFTVLTMLLLAGSVQASEQASKARQAQIEKRGAQVMPFSLDRTLHIFTKTNSGGIQQVVVKDPSDTRRIAMIREHLDKISQEFAQGDFSDPASIHGSDMPGLAELEKAHRGQLRIEYKQLARGAQIAYRSDDPAMIDAIHRWFDAQLSDHAGHAVPGHAGHQMEKQ